MWNRSCASKAGGRAGLGFVPEEFIRGLRLGIRKRAAQPRAADKVIAAVARRLSKSSYGDMATKYGCGRLIVGFPLWFASLPLDPQRVEKVVDDFTRRVGIGLRGFAR